MKVLVTEPLSEAGLEIFRQTPGLVVDLRLGLSPEELRRTIAPYHGLAIRGGTSVTAELIEAAENLKVIGRAGVGIDNVDIRAASRRGIVLMNTPEGNIITAAEHAIAMILALSRNIPQATASLKEGRWEKDRLQGREICNKTLGLIGVGHIGRIVAEKARALKMRVIAYDPYIKPAALEKLDVEPVAFEELLEKSDYISIHAPKTNETSNMINRETIGRMKPGAMLINCARGGIVDEDDLYEALRSKRLWGAALDVFANEPPGKSKLMSLENFICTPHLGASTKEAQENVAREVAEQIVAYLLHGTVRNAVNVPGISPELMSTLRPFAVLAEKMGSFQTQLTDSAVEEVRIEYSGKVADHDVAPLTTAFLKGLLTPVLKEDVNFVNARYVASDRGIKVIESKTSTSDDFASLISATVRSLEGENLVSGTIFGKEMPRILKINSFSLEAVPEGHILLIHSLDVPGVIGGIASSLGEHGVNIGRMQVGQEKQKRQNVILLTTDIPVTDGVLESILDRKNVFSARRITL